MPPTDPDEQLARFASLVRRSPHNLVSASAARELESRHIPEARALAHMLPSGPPVTRLLDVGSGGGLPGLVIALERPDLEVHLLDSRGKKTAFLRETAADLGIAVQVHTGRAEDLANGDLQASFHVVTARAVAPLARLLGWTLPFLEVGGLLYAVKGERWEEELADAVPALRREQGRVVATPDDIDQATPTAPRVVIVGKDAPDRRR
ncbi:MAG: 16S rRNA (guanine(527)-N(7))-methyltransferase RsmG [Nitriliruptoraceae bacterium]